MTDVLADYQKWCYSVANAMSNNCTDADDLAQEGLIAMWRALEKYDPAKGALPSWLTKAAKMRMLEVVQRKNLFGNARVQGAKSVEHLSYDEFEDPDSVLPYVEYNSEIAAHRDEIRNALDVLSPAQRRYVVAKFWLGLDSTSRSPAMVALCKQFPELKRGSDLWNGTTGQVGARDRLAEALGHLDAEW